MNKRIILVGPSAAGKNFIRQKFVEKGYVADCSYTSREPREGEVDGVDYKFISKDLFMAEIANGGFYEWVEYNGHYYGTGLIQWKHCDIFIMESDGIKHITQKDRRESLVIYVNTSYKTRYWRMIGRGWNEKKIIERQKVDVEKFINFTDFDLEIFSDVNMQSRPIV